ncbi:MAG: UDP-3-O-(3-hydroxymyristoyl)glucosamine N-acyltransferase [Candidatus Sumerlaeota bacterium]|nr:UDP-3-O-(3-hydroxymyristoyl)glucosamine N-acyltransferase [Candidatus Sumerlaeota bacterium]
MKLTISEVAALVDGEAIGDGALVLTGLNAFDLAKEGDLTFAGGKAYLGRIEQTRATCVLVPQDFAAPCSKTLIKVKDPKVAFALVLARVYQPEKRQPGIHATAAVAAGAAVGKDVYIGPHAVIEDGASVGDECDIGAGTVVGRRVKIGPRSVIHANVTLYYDITIGADVIIHSGTVVGADGFGYVFHDGVQHKVPQTGTVIIEDNVEIGANVAIDRATFGATVIGAGSKIDNLCQVAHNVQIGRNVIMAGQSGVAGSTIIGDNAIIAAQAGVRDNIEIGAGAVIGAKSGVANSVSAGQQVLGSPAREISETKKQFAAMARLTPHASTLARMARKQEKEG